MLAASLRTSARIAVRRPATFAIAARPLSSARALLNNKVGEHKSAYSIQDVEGPESLLGPGSKQGEVPNDVDQATGLERLELLGLLAGVKVFDTAPLQSDRTGTMADPIMIDSYETYRYVGCTGSPAGSHEVQWLRPSTEQVSRCWECGSVYKINYLGLEEEHDHHHH